MKKNLEELFRDRVRQFEDALRKSPKSIRRAGKVVRNGDMREFRKLLRREGIVILNKDMEAFRDYFITQRLDLKDLEPEARKRLRVRTLEAGPGMDQATEDYRNGILSGTDLTCKECKWFVAAPHDGDGDNHEKTCVELGAKGTDAACVGFLWPITATKSA